MASYKITVVHRANPKFSANVVSLQTELVEHSAICTKPVDSVYLWALIGYSNSG